MERCPGPETAKTRAPAHRRSAQRMAWPRASLYRTTQNGRAGRVVIVRVVGANGPAVVISNEDSLAPPRLGFTRRFEAKLRYSYRSKRQRRSPATESISSAELSRSFLNELSAPVRQSTSGLKRECAMPDK